MATINSVMGPIETAQLGFTLLHEHVCSTSPGFWQAWPSLFGGRDEFIARAVDELTAAKEAGVDTFVDVTPMDLGRDIRLIKEVSERSGMTIIAATGHWLDPSWSMKQRTVEELTDFFTSEIEDGIEGTDVKAGIIKIAHDQSPQLIEWGLINPDHTGFGEKITRAAARTHQRTGVPITTHTGAKLELGSHQADILEDEGVEPSRVYLGHSDDSDSPSYLTGLMDRGYLMGFDHLCWGGLLTPAFEVRVATTVDLVQRGYAENIALSHDFALAISLFTTEEERNVFRPMNPDGIQFIHKRYIPALQANGITDETVQQIMVENPRRYFEG